MQGRAPAQSHHLLALQPSHQNLGGGRPQSCDDSGLIIRYRRDDHSLQQAKALLQRPLQIGVRIHRRHDGDLNDLLIPGLLQKPRDLDTGNTQSQSDLALGQRILIISLRYLVEKLPMLRI